MTSSNRTRTDLDLDVVVVLADPRLENPYHASEAQKEHDDQDVTHLREVMGALLDEERVTYLDDHDRLIDDLRQCRADVVLNFCNAGFRNQTDLQKNVPALLEMLGLRYAGADAGCLAICHDKAGVNAAAKRSGIPVARQEVVRLGADGDLPTQYPAVLKPNEAAGSMGITTGSVVHDQEQAARRLDELAQESVDTKWVVAEEFLDGREVSVAVLGSVDPDQPPSCLPPVEIDFSRLPEGLPRIMTHGSKAAQESLYWNRIDLRPAELSAGMKEEVEAYCVRMFDRLGCRDYARFDFRTDDEGVPRLIDANAHPEWGSEGMVATMAAFAGLDYEELLAHIILSARNNPVVRQPTAKGEPVEAVVGADGIRLRPTRPDDVAFVREVESAPDNRDHVEQWSAEEHLTALEADHTVHLIIENEDRDRVGYVVLEGLKSPDKAMLLRRIVVGRKREHIGDRAMTATERYCFDPRVPATVVGGARRQRACPGPVSTSRLPRGGPIPHGPDGDGGPPVRVGTLRASGRRAGLRFVPCAGCSDSSEPTPHGSTTGSSTLRTRFSRRVARIWRGSRMPTAGASPNGDRTVSR